MACNREKRMMKKFMPFIVLMAATPALAVTPAGQGRRSTAAQMVPAQRASATNMFNPTASMATLKVIQSSGTPVMVDNSGNAGNTGNNANNGNSGANDTPNTSAPTDEEQKDMREKEKSACINNNIGTGNTFVWASRYSNVNNYASMVEDIDEPANNTCFVRVEMKSDDSRISVADIPAKYFEMGQTITCGAWADEKTLEKRILDAKKSARTWGTVAGTVGGAAVGVGAMELFGNKLIGGSVQGQKALNDNELLYSQLAVLKKNKDPQYNQIMAELRNLKAECENADVWTGAAEKPEGCIQIDYARMLNLDSAL